MTNQELTSVWTLQESAAFEDALERRKMRQRDVAPAYGAPAYSAPHADQGSTRTSVPDADISTTSDKSGGLMIRIAGMAVAAVILAAIATFGLTG